MNTTTKTLRALAAATLTTALALTGCVAEGKYDEALKSAADAKLACDASMKAWAARAAALEAATHADEARLATADAREAQLLRAVDAAKVQVDMLRGELQHTGENEVLYKSLALRLKTMVDAGDLRIVLRSGRMVLSLPNDVLFDSGSTELKPAGKKSLATVASVLSTVPSRRFQIAGDTDSEPIHTPQFASNWELSTARAVQVVHFLIKSGGMKPTLLSAAGYGEFDPVAANDTAADRARNRRIEITVMPDLTEVVGVPDRY